MFFCVIINLFYFNVESDVEESPTKYKKIITVNSAGYIKRSYPLTKKLSNEVFKGNYLFVFIISDNHACTYICEFIC